MRIFKIENANPRLTIHGQTDKKLGFGVSPRIHTDIQTNRKTNISSILNQIQKFKYSHMDEWILNGVTPKWWRHRFCGVQWIFFDLRIFRILNRLVNLGNVLITKVIKNLELIRSWEWKTDFLISNHYITSYKYIGQSSRTSLSTKRT